MGWETPIKTGISRCHGSKPNIMNINWMWIIKQNKTKHHTQNACVCVWVVYITKSSLLRMYVYQSSNISTYLSVCSCVCLYVCSCVCLYVCLSVCLFVCLSVRVSPCLSVCLPVCMSVCMSVCLPVCLSVSMSVCIFVFLSVCMSVYLSVYMSVCYFCFCLNLYLSIMCSCSCVHLSNLVSNLTLPGYIDNVVQLATRSNNSHKITRSI